MRAGLSRLAAAVAARARATGCARAGAGARAIRLGAAIAAALCGGIAAPRLAPLPDWLHARPAPTSVLVLDRDGGLLAERHGSGPVRGRDLGLDAIDPLLVRATLAAEDRRFYRHPGVDPLALARASLASLRHGRPLEGASTLTMQVVRLARGRPRGAVSRAVEVWWALVLESHLAKERILEIYLNRAPYGPRTEGADAGARRLFGKPPAVLSPAEAALLAALPRSPVRLDPERHPSAARAARDAVLDRMERLGSLPAADAARARDAEVHLATASPPQPPRRAPHLVDWVLDSLGEDATRACRVTTTCDPAVQGVAQEALAGGLARLHDRRVRGGAVVVLDTQAAEVRALVGSAGFESADAGQVNAALAPRQPGSAVKPFVYAAAFAGSIRPSTILADVPTSYEGRGGIFAPRNYAGEFAGPVPARLALANSWNVPAVEVLRRTGPADVARVFARLGLVREGDAERLGLGLTLGAGEATLLDLAAAYATLARGGTWLRPRAVLEARDEKGNSIPLGLPESRDALDPIACSWVDEILSDPAARAEAFERGGPLEIDGPAAAKTGTSSDWRDSWAILYTMRHTVAVWMGNPDGSPTDRLTGAQGPAMVARAILDALEKGAPSAPFPVPEGIERRPVCPLSGCAAGADCPLADWSPFRTDDPSLPPCAAHAARRIDAASGLLARPCTPPSRVRRMVFVELPERFALWQADRGMRGAPGGVTECLCGSPSCRPLDAIAQPFAGARAPTAEIAILRPVEGTLIAYDPTLPRRQQQLAVEAIAPAGAMVVWKIDGNVQGTTRGIHRLYWPIVPGTHRIEASLSDGLTPAAVTRTVTVLPAGGVQEAALRASDP